jgi:hypothetical protein
MLCVAENFEGNAEAGPSKPKSAKLLGKSREVVSEEEKRKIEEGKKAELLRMVGRSQAMNKELEKLHEAIDELREELGL